MGGKSQQKILGQGYTEIERRHVAKIGRNAPCPCGSGKKYKECHEREGSLFLEKLAHENEKQKLREKRQGMKERGVPWYKRLLARS